VNEEAADWDALLAEQGVGEEEDGIWVSQADSN
jgi:hypothetical protein